MADLDVPTKYAAMDDDELTRAICVAAVKAGHEPEDHGVIAPAEIVSTTDLAVSSSAKLSSMPTKRELQQAHARLQAQIALRRDLDKWILPFAVLSLCVFGGSLFAISPELTTLTYAILYYKAFCKPKPKARKRKSR
jgi:hypothetical protein